MSMIRVLLVGFGCVVIIAMWCIIQTQEANPAIPSAAEIQQKLKDLDSPRYDPGKVDGIIGRQSQTAWDNYICDQAMKGE